MPELGRTDIARRQTFRLRKRWLALPVLALAVWLAGVSLFRPPPPPRPAPIAFLTPRPAPVTATDFLAQGDADFELEYYDQAIADYSRAIALKPDYADAFNNRAYTYMTIKEYALALPDLDQAIRIRPDYVHALMNRGTSITTITLSTVTGRLPITTARSRVTRVPTTSPKSAVTATLLRITA